MKAYNFQTNNNDQIYRIHTMAHDQNEAKDRVQSMITHYNQKAPGAIPPLPLHLSLFQMTEYDDPHSTSYGRREPHDWIMLDRYKKTGPDSFQELESMHIVKKIERTETDDEKMRALFTHYTTEFRKMAGIQTEENPAYVPPKPSHNPIKLSNDFELYTSEPYKPAAFGRNAAYGIIRKTDGELTSSEFNTIEAAMKSFSKGDNGINCLLISQKNENYIDVAIQASESGLKKFQNVENVKALFLSMFNS